MTREEAIKVIESLKQLKDGGVFVNLNEALGMAIEALEKWRETNDTWYEEVYNMAIEALSADAVQGEWIIRENGNKECSLCGHERQDGWDYFCGYCGARMKGGAE